MQRILVVDDEQDYVDSLKEILENNNYDVIYASNQKMALEKLELYHPDLVTLDLDLGDGQEIAGIHILEDIRKQWDDVALPVLIVSGTGNMDKCMKTLNHGANDYVTKPVNFKILLETIKRNLHAGAKPEENKKATAIGNMIGGSNVMINLAQQIHQFSTSDSNTLILGETGTGKDLVAQLFHKNSRRSNKAFIKVDCTTIPENLFESIVFGQREGGFTGSKNIPGCVEKAHGGIVFFDEIGELSLDHQAKLLNLLESETITPIGSAEAIKVDVVLLAATNRDLYKMVKSGLFRKDLYYRLNNTVIHNPPLCDHMEDIPLLVEHFILLGNGEFNRNIVDINKEALMFLNAQKWEGNVRQLKNCIYSGVRKCVDHIIQLSDIRNFFREELEDSTLSGGLQLSQEMMDMDHKTFKQEVLQDLEKEYVLNNLKKHMGNKKETAQALGFKNYQQLNQVMQRLAIKDEELN